MSLVILTTTADVKPTLFSLYNRANYAHKKNSNDY